MAGQQAVAEVAETRQKREILVIVTPHIIYDTEAHADGARPRREVLWLNALAFKRLEESREQPSLFLTIPSTGAPEQD